MITLFRQSSWISTAVALISLPALCAQSPATAPVKVTIEEDKTEFTDRVLPLDPAIRVAYEYVGNMSFGVNGEGKRLTCGAGSAHTVFKIDGQVYYPDAQPGNIKAGQAAMPGAPQPLPPGPNNKKRTGIQTTWAHNDIKVTMILEVVPGRPYDKTPGATSKKRMDTLLIKYVIENTGAKSHQVGVRMYIDTMCGNNDGAIFASPTTHPGQLLDGVMLQNEKVPEFIEMLERPNLQAPGFKGIFTFKMGKQVEAPNKIVLTSLGAFGDWDVPAIQAGGDSAVAFFWDPKEVKAKSKREVAFAIGQSIACNPENEGKVSLQFAGNFEPKKEFTVTAYIDDPIDGQNLTLELPKGMEGVGGKATQAVPTANGAGQSVIMWKARVLDLGSHELRIRSSNGVTYTRIITISRN